ncbi:MAG: transposase, partial [Akkermansiaceae bacterium]|nr:transposase [Akkermansiaceae bacterium]
MKAIANETSGMIIQGQSRPAGKRTLFEGHFIQPGKPVQNCFVESFNDKFRDECLNEHWFLSLYDTREKILEGGVRSRAPAQLAAETGRRRSFGAIVLKTGDGGSVTRLRDVARVELGSNTYALNSYLNNEEASAIVIFEAPGANSIALSDAVRAKMTELKQNFPEGVDYAIAYDPTVFVRASVDVG